MADDHTRYEAVIGTPFDTVKLGINIKGDALYNIDFISADYKDYVPYTGFIREVVRQLTAYFDNPQFTFSLPLLTLGTPFQKRVWQTLRGIPSGKPWSYGKVAQYLGTSARAIGGACRANSIPIVIPCHRVVAANGIGGFSGQRQGYKVDIKNRLLTHEHG